jgi:hypothetical protein
VLTGEISIDILAQPRERNITNPAIVQHIRRNLDIELDREIEGSKIKMKLITILFSIWIFINRKLKLWTPKNRRVTRDMHHTLQKSAKYTTGAAHDCNSFCREEDTQTYTNRSSKKNIGTISRRPRRPKILLHCVTMNSFTPANPTNVPITDVIILCRRVPMYFPVAAVKYDTFQLTQDHEEQE